MILSATAAKLKRRAKADAAGSVSARHRRISEDWPAGAPPIHYVTKHLQQGIESDYFRVKKNMPRVGGFRSFATARRTIQGFEAMLWLRKGFGFAGARTVCEQNHLLAPCFGLPAVNKV